MKKNLSILTSVSLLGALGVTYTQCGSKHNVNGMTVEEKSALVSSVFVVDPVTPDTDIVVDDGSEPTNDKGDSFLPSNPYKADSDAFKWVARCNELETTVTKKDVNEYVNEVGAGTGIIPGTAPHQNIKTSRDFELAVVKKIAEQRILDIKAGKLGADGKALPLLIPVEFTFSTGDKHDATSFMAYRRSILRNDSDGLSYIQTSTKTYVVNHEGARADFISGKHQYYSLVPVSSVVADYNVAYKPFVAKQPFAIWGAYNMHKVGSGVGNIKDIVEQYDAKKDVPVARLFLADVRDKILPTNGKVDIMYEDIAKFTRNSEVTRRLKDIFKVKNMFQKRGLLGNGLSVDREVNLDGFKAKYAGYSGMPQLVQRMTCDLGSTSRIGAQYTPIVLDLGSPYIRTSSENWGTFFNISNANITLDGKPLDNEGEDSYTHRTAWVGGYLKKVPNPILGDLSSNQTIVPFREHWDRVAEDGFLVLQTGDKPISAKNLFGASFVNPDKPDAEYENGFLALQDYAGTTADCNAQVPELSYTGEGPTDEQLNTHYGYMKKRYLGPWNEKFDKLKVWVDANRDGLSQPGEIKGLQESGVQAINTCLTSANQVSENDQFGNNTKLRSAFLYGNGALSEQETLRSITLGKNSSGQKAHFRLMVDIFFRARPLHFLERSLKYRSEAIKKPDSHKVLIHGASFEEEDADVPMVFN